MTQRSQYIDVTEPENREKLFKTTRKQAKTIIKNGPTSKGEGGGGGECGQTQAQRF